MIRLQAVRNVMVVLVALVLLVGSAVPAFAQDECVPGDSTMCFPAGTGCEFALQIDIGSGGSRNHHEFTDKDGNLVAVLEAGRGTALTYTNLSNGETMSTKANGAVSITALNPDGTQTATMMGHNVLILYPTDVPAGPSTTLYVGRVVFTVDANGVFTVVESNGTSMDICAALSD